MSLRRKVSHFLALVVIAALSVSLFAGAADAKTTKLSAKQKAHIRAKLRKQIRKHPGVIRHKSFIKKAALVNFRLPVTIRLRSGDYPATPTDEGATNNPNSANIDLGPSLGQREIDLGGSLAAEIVFHDSFDGGALGNVDIDIRPGPKSLTSTSIPLLWNSDVSSGRWDHNAMVSAGVPEGTPGFAAQGCGNFNGTVALPFGAPFIGGAGGLAGFPFYHPAVAGTYPAGYLPEKPGADSLDNLTDSKTPGDPNNLGGNPNPFPSAPGLTTADVSDTVLRTGPLNLQVAGPGTVVPQLVPDNGATDPAGNTPVQNSQEIVIGKSGGQANLFGNIPGKSYGIDVTVSLATRINSIFRIVDQDVNGGGLFSGDPYPAALFVCRQIWSGGVDNYIPGVRLQGSLKISPAITSDGKLRIAKATISSGAEEKANVALAACLAPYAAFATEQNSSDTNPSTIPAGAAPPPALVGDGSLPLDTASHRDAPAADCNADPTQLVKDGALPPDQVTQLLGADTNNGYTINNDGSRAVVSGQLTVNNVSADVLIGDV